MRLTVLTIFAAILVTIGLAQEPEISVSLYKTLDVCVPAAFNPDWTMIAGSDGANIHISDVQTGKKIRTLEGKIFEYDYSDSCYIISTAGMILVDSTIHYNVGGYALYRTRDEYSYCVTSVCFSPDGTILASTSWNEIKLWRVSDGSELRTLNGHSNAVSSVCFSPDGKLLVSGSIDGTINIWNVSEGDLLETLNGHRNEIESVCFSHDGSILGSMDRSNINLWRVSDWSLQKTLRERFGGGDTYSICFSPDDSLMASGTRYNKAIMLWSVSDGKLLKRFKHPYDHITEIVTVNSVCFSPDGSIIAASSQNPSPHAVRLWRVSDGSVINTFEEHNVWSVSFSPDGSLLASIGSRRRGNEIKGVNLWKIDPPLAPLKK